MSYHIKIKTKEAFEWMKGLIENTISSDTHAKHVSYPHLQDWIDGFNTAEVDSGKSGTRPVNSEISTDAQSNFKKEVRSKKKTAANKKASSEDSFVHGKLARDGLSCTIHKKYGGIRSPRSECKGCWALFKKMNPMEYPAKLRAFKAKQNNKNSQTS